MATANKTTGRKKTAQVAAPTDESTAVAAAESPQELVGNIEVQQEEAVSVDAGSSVTSSSDVSAAVVAEVPQESAINTSVAKNQLGQIFDAVANGMLAAADRAKEAKITGAVAGQDDALEATAVRVRSVSPKGFRRCGRVWSPEFAEVSIDSLPDGAVDILLKDPDLVVELVSDPAVSGK